MRTKPPVKQLNSNKQNFNWHIGYRRNTTVTQNLWKCIPNWKAVTRSIDQDIGANYGAGRLTLSSALCCWQQCCCPQPWRWAWAWQCPLSLPLPLPAPLAPCLPPLPLSALDSLPHWLCCTNATLGNELTVIQSSFQNTVFSLLHNIPHSQSL